MPLKIRKNSANRNARRVQRLRNKNVEAIVLRMLIVNRKPPGRISRKPKIRRNTKNVAAIDAEGTLARISAQMRFRLL